MISQVEQLRSVVASQAERIRHLEQQIENMDRDLCASREAHDLLEFQVLENEENNKQLGPSQRHDKCIGTEKMPTERHNKASGTSDLESGGSQNNNEEALALKLREYNTLLEHQFKTQSQIIEAMKKKLAEQKAFADLVHKLAKMDEAGTIREHLDNYIDSAESETKVLAENFSRIIRIQPNNSSEPLRTWFPVSNRGSLSSNGGC